MHRIKTRRLTRNARSRLARNRRRLVAEPLETKALLALVFEFDSSKILDLIPTQSPGESEGQALERFEATLSVAKEQLDTLAPTAPDATVTISLIPPEVELESLQGNAITTTATASRTIARPPVRFPRIGWREANLYDIRPSSPEFDGLQTTLPIEVDPAFLDAAWVDPRDPATVPEAADRIDFSTDLMRSVLQGIAFNGSDNRAIAGTPFDSLTFGSTFSGPRAVEEYGSDVPLSTEPREFLSPDEFATDLENPDTFANLVGIFLAVPGDLMDEQLNPGERRTPSDLDRAILKDVGLQRVEIDSPAPTVTEGSGPFPVRAIYGGPLPNLDNLRLSIATVDGSAEAGRDFRFTPADPAPDGIIEAGPPEDVIPHDLVIDFGSIEFLDDAVFQPSRTFDLVVTADEFSPGDLPENAFNSFEIARMTVTIEDDDGVRIEPVDASLPENEGPFRIDLVREGTPRALDLTVTTEPGTAEPGVDYEAIETVISVAEEDNIPRIEIPILPTEEVRPNRTFFVIVTDNGGTPNDPSDDLELDRVELTILTDAPPQEELRVLSVGPVSPTPRNQPVESVAVTLSRAVPLASFPASAVHLERDGEPVDLGSSLEIESDGGANYRIVGLEEFTEESGAYRLTVDGSEITDGEGGTGIGSASTEFKVDTVAPSIVRLSEVASPRTTPVGSIEVVLTEPIIAESFTTTALTLTRNGTPVSLDDVTIEPVEGTDDTYRIAGLAALTEMPGTYVLTVNANGIRDLAGNDGAGSATRGFIVGDMLPNNQNLAGDYDGDGIADLALYRYDPNTRSAVFSIQYSNFGSPTEGLVAIEDVDSNVIPISGDFDGDGKTDVAVVNPTARLGGSVEPNASLWIILLSGSNNFRREVPFGAAGVLDRPAPADFDGDGITDIATFRASSDLTPGAAEWFILPSRPNPGFETLNGAFNVVFGAAGGTDLPAPFDFDGDGRAEIATFRPVPTPEDEARGLSSVAQWLILPSSSNDETFGERLGGFPVVFGAGGNADQPVVADFDNDGRDDIAAFRSVTDLPNNFRWFILPSAPNQPNYQTTNGGRAVSFGNDGVIAAVSDYDNDGRPDLAIFDPSNDRWTIRQGVDGPERTVTYNPLGPGAVPVLSPLYFRLDATGNNLARATGLLASSRLVGDDRAELVDRALAMLLEVDSEELT